MVSERITPGVARHEVGKMPENTAEQEAPSSIICKDLHIHGDLKSDGHLHIDGTIKGDLQVASIVVGEKGTIEGSVIANIIDVHGFVSGNITSRVVQLRSTAHVVGDTMHEDLLVEKGACLNGNFRKLPLKERVQTKSTHKSKKKRPLSRPEPFQHNALAPIQDRVEEKENNKAI